MNNDQIHEVAIVKVDPQLKKCFSTRMTIKNVYQLMLHVNGIQSLREQVQSIGLGGLLDLKCKKVPNNLAYWLLENLHKNSCSLHLCDGQIFRISPQDVHLTLGLPYGGMKVLDKHSIRGVDHENYLALLETFRDRFQITGGSITLLKIFHHLMQQTEPSEWFAGDFVLFVVSSTISGNQNGNINLHVLKSLGNVHQIKNYDWCSYNGKFEEVNTTLAKQ